MKTRREFLAAACGAFVGVSCAGAARAASPGLPVSQNDLLVASAEGLVFLDFGIGQGLPAGLLGGGDTASQLSAVLASLLQGELGTALPRVRNGHRGVQKIAQLSRKHLLRGKQRHAHAQPAGSQLDTAALAIAFSASGLTLAESLSLTLSFGSIAHPVTYTTALSLRQTLSGGPATHVQLDYSAEPSGSVDGSLVAALLRDTSKPDAGLLAVALLDSTLPDQLAEFNLTNTNAFGANVSIPLGLTLSGAVSGDHAAPVGSALSSFYLAVKDGFGLAVSGSISSPLL